MGLTERQMKQFAQAGEPPPTNEAVAKGKIVWAGNMLPVAVRATRPPLPKFDETPFLAHALFFIKMA